MRDEVIDRIDAAAKRYPIKKLASELNKAESTFRNELTQQPGYKLGFWDAVMAIRKTGDLSPLDMVEEELFGRVCMVLPVADITNPAPLLRLMADVSREFGEDLAALSETWKNGSVNPEKIKRCLKENRDLIKKCLEIEANLKNYLGALK